jgi:hypothetical protein
LDVTDEGANYFCPMSIHALFGRIKISRLNLIALKKPSFVAISEADLNWLTRLLPSWL